MTYSSGCSKCLGTHGAVCIVREVVLATYLVLVDGFVDGLGTMYSDKVGFLCIRLWYKISLRSK